MALLVAQLVTKALVSSKGAGSNPRLWWKWTFVFFVANEKDRCAGDSTWSHIFVHLVYFYTVTPKIHLKST